MQQILLNTESEEHTVQLGQTGPCKGYCLLNTGVGIMDGMEKEKGKRMRKEQVCTREDGQLGHTHGELVNFIYWILTFSFWIFLNPPSPSPTMVEKPHRSRQGLIRPAQSLQSTPGWPTVACGGASQSSHRQAGPVD